MTDSSRDDLLGTLIPSLAATSRLYFMGVSLMRCAYFSKQRVAAHVQHTGSNGRPFLLIVADSLESVNYHYLRKLPRAEAIRRASAAGEAYFRGYLRLASTLPQLSVIRSAVIERTPACSRFAHAVTEHFHRSKRFRHRIQHEVIHNIGYRAKPLLATVDEEPRIEEYLLREIAISLTLYSIDGYEEIIQVSPNPHGVLATLHQETALLGSIGMSPRRLQYIEQTLPDVRKDVA